MVTNAVAPTGRSERPESIAPVENDPSKEIILCAMDLRLVDKRWDYELARLFAGSGGLMEIICPFITEPALSKVVGKQAPKGARVITRLNLDDFAAGVSDIWALQTVLAAGGQVRGVRGLHSKVFVFGEHAAAVTSANLTLAGITTNSEFGCVSDLPEFIATCQAYFDELWDKSGPSVTLEQLEAWDDEVTDARARGGGSWRRRYLKDYGAVVGRTKTKKPAVPAVETSAEMTRPAWLPEATLGRVKFFGTADDRIPRDRSMTQQLQDSGAHWSCTYPRGKRPTGVKDGTVMYLAAMVDDEPDYLIFGRGRAMPYVPGRDDASAEDIEERWWREKWSRYIRISDPEIIAGTVNNGVSLYEMFDELEADAIGPTQENKASGDPKANLDPRHSIMQKADVRLSPEGLAWMNERFDAALAKHGHLPTDELEKLDWPDLPDSAVGDQA